MSAQMSLPPVLRSVTVAVPAERAFEVFTRRIGDWWPLHAYSLFEEKSATVGFEGGLLVERSADGEEHRGWERIGDEAEQARAGYESGWPGVLERYAQTVEDLAA